MIKGQHTLYEIFHKLFSDTNGNFSRQNDKSFEIHFPWFIDLYLSDEQSEALPEDFKINYALYTFNMISEKKEPIDDKTFTKLVKQNLSNYRKTKN